MRGLRPPTMGRTVDVDELVSTIEIAERLKLKNADLVRAWRRRYADFSLRVRTSEGRPLQSWRGCQQTVDRLGDAGRADPR